jgi:phosphate transport system substrate-binding protein
MFPQRWQKGGTPMIFERVLLVLYSAATIIMASQDQAAWGQTRPVLEPGIPSYAYEELPSDQLTISGSDPMKPLIYTWVDALVERHPSLHVKVTGDASGIGLAPLLEHRTQIAALSRRMTAAEISEFIREYGFEPMEIPVAIDALAIFAHKDNPIPGLSLEDLDAMFCDERRRGIRHAIDSWGLVGLGDEWLQTPVQLYGRNGTSGMGHFFREEVCKGGPFSPRLNEFDGSASVVLELGIDQAGIGFSMIGYRSSMVRPIPIASVKGGRYVEPTFQTATDGSYPLRRHLYFYVAATPKSSLPPGLTALIRFALSAQGQQIALDHGYVPLASMEVRRLASKWSPTVKAAQSGTPGPTKPQPGS